MKISNVLFSLLFLVLLSSFSSADYFNKRSPNSRESEAVLLQSVKAITLESGKYTIGNKPILQLQCIGGSAYGARNAYPDVVQCVNVGSDSSGDPQWRCEADLDTSVRFGKTKVSCEGYSHPQDPYIWKGSCGLEYNLEYTQEGRNQHNNHYSDSYHSNYGYSSSSNSSGFGSLILFIIIVVIIFGIIGQLRNTQPYQGPNPYPQNTYYGNSYPGNSYPGNYRPGFWSGFGGGSLFGYFAGRNNRPYGYQPPPTSFGGHSSPSPRGSTTRTATSYSSTDRR